MSQKGSSKISQTVKVAPICRLFTAADFQRGLCPQPEDMSLLFNKAENSNILCSIRTLFSKLTLFIPV